MSTSLNRASDPLWRRVLRFCFGIERFEHAWWETLIFRLLIAWAAWDSLSGPSRFHSQPRPHGLAAWGVDFSWLGSEQIMTWFVPLIGVCLFIYIVLPLVPDMTALTNRRLPAAARNWIGWIHALALLVPLYASFGHGTLGNSQRAIGHTTQIVTSVLLAQWLALTWAAIRGGEPSRLPRGYNSQQLAADWTRQLIMATYVASAITKLWVSHGDWLAETPYFGLQVAKATGQAYYEWLQPPNNAAWMAQFLFDHPFVGQILIGVALPLELFAFLGLNNRRAALFFGVCLAGFHCSVTEIMHLGFVYHKLFLFMLFGNPVWWIVTGAGGLLRHSPRESSATAQVARQS